MKEGKASGSGNPEKEKEIDIDRVEEQVADVIKGMETLGPEQLEVPADLSERIQAAGLTELDEIEKELGLGRAEGSEKALRDENPDAKSVLVQADSTSHRVSGNAAKIQRASSEPAIEENEDGSFEISISDDAMRAFINLTPSRGHGTPLTLESIKQRLIALKVVFGIKEDLLKRLIETVERTKERKKGVIIAQGVEPGAGEDGSIKFLFTEMEAP